MEQAINAYHQEGNLRHVGSVEVQEGNLRHVGSVEVQITADPVWELERMREIARHNEASALRHARNESEAETTLEIARKMKEMGFPNEQIQTVTGLPDFL